MLRGLHDEIARLQGHCSDLSVQLVKAQAHAISRATTQKDPVAVPAEQLSRRRSQDDIFADAASDDSQEEYDGTFGGAQDRNLDKNSAVLPPLSNRGRKLPAGRGAGSSARTPHPPSDPAPRGPSVLRKSYTNLGGGGSTIPAASSLVLRSSQSRSTAALAAEVILELGAQANLTAAQVVSASAGKRSLQVLPPIRYIDDTTETGDSDASLGSSDA
ncbi:hypothetical protein HKX48_007023 [Thoreauomyces humboldtii]|nr:hypothetical protein HKX48_007023 [Thoreauomyces humboldtii]